MTDRFGLPLRRPDQDIGAVFHISESRTKEPDKDANRMILSGDKMFDATVASCNTIHYRNCK